MDGIQNGTYFKKAENENLEIKSQILKYQKRISSNQNKIEEIDITLKHEERERNMGFELRGELKGIIEGLESKILEAN